MARKRPGTDKYNQIMTVSVILVAAILVSIAGYSELFISHYIAEKEAEPNYGEKYELWKSKNINNYSFRLDSLCGLSPYINIEVRDNKVVSPNDDYYPTIDDLFDLINQGEKTADVIEAEYHDIGFPHAIFIDWNKRNWDDECDVVLNDFRTLSGFGLFPTIHHRDRNYKNYDRKS